MFYFNMEPRLKWNKIVLAAKTFLFYFRRGLLKHFISFQMWFHVKIKY